MTSAHPAAVVRSPARIQRLVPPGGGSVPCAPASRTSATLAATAWPLGRAWWAAPDLTRGAGDPPPTSGPPSRYPRTAHRPHAASALIGRAIAAPPSRRSSARSVRPRRARHSRLIRGRRFPAGRPVGGTSSVTAQARAATRRSRPRRSGGRPRRAGSRQNASLAPEPHSRHPVGERTCAACRAAPVLVVHPAIPPRARGSIGATARRRVSGGAAGGAR